MHQTTRGRIRPVIDRRNNQAVRDIAKLRARRAARLAAESAAGRRRMVVAGVCALLTVGLGIVIAVASLPVAWILVPVVALAASLGASRVAAVRSQRASERELELLTKLRGDVRGRTTPRAPADSEGSRVGVGGRDGASASEGERNGDAAEPSTGSTSLVFSVDVPEVVEVADTPARAWTVAPVPAPTYASRERIRGRIVHADTDLRGIPRIAAAVPARPIAATAQAGARSTAEVVADQAVALDLDAVLDARRAQSDANVVVMPRRGPEGPRRGRMRGGGGVLLHIPTLRAATVCAAPEAWWRRFLAHLTPARAVAGPVGTWNCCLACGFVDSRTRRWSACVGAGQGARLLESLGLWRSW